MKTVISVRDLEEMVRNGQDVRVLPDDVILTPSAKDFLRDYDRSTTTFCCSGLSCRMAA